MSATYRAESDQEPVAEAAVSALLPATCERLDEAFRREEALAYRRHALVEHPVRWLLAGGVGFALLVTPPLRQFGHIDGELFAAQLPARALLTGSFVWGLACTALGLRSLVLRRGGLPSGVHLFASCLLEVKEGRLRVWPISRLRAVAQRERVATLDFGADGRLQLTTDERDLVATFAHLQEQLTQARLTHDSTTAALLDPVYAERERGTLRPIAGVAQLPAAASTGQVVATWVASALLLVLVSVLLVVMARDLSDRVGIEQARRAADTEQLKAYLSQDGPLARQADHAWFSLCKSDAQLIEYMRAPYARHQGDADDVLARRVLARTSPARPMVTPGTEGDVQAPFDRARAMEDLRSYLGLGIVTLPPQPLRPQLDQRLFDLSIAESDSIRCNQQGEPLRGYLDRDDVRGDQAREAQWRRIRQSVQQCGSFIDLEMLRSLATTPPRQDEFRELWGGFFDQQRQLFDRSARPHRPLSSPALAPEALPGSLVAQVDQVWTYVSRYPELQLRPLGSSLGSRTSADDWRDRKAGWVALMRVRLYRRSAWKHVLEDLRGTPVAWQIHDADSCLIVQDPPRTPVTKADEVAIQSILRLPGSEPQAAEYTVPCLCEPAPGSRPGKNPHPPLIVEPHWY